MVLLRLGRTPPRSPPPPTPSKTSPLGVLEVTIVSAQDLHPAVRKSMRTYAIAFIHPATQLRTTVDRDGHVGPTWNEKLSFNVDDDVIRSDTAAISIDIYAVRSRLRLGPRKTLLGTARALISTVKPNPRVRFFALQVRRPSLRPQGILNIGVALVDDQCSWSGPLFIEIAPTVAVADGGKDSEDKDGIVETAARRQLARDIEEKLKRWKGETEEDEKREGTSGTCLRA